MAVKIQFIADDMFPKPPLPNAAARLRRLLDISDILSGPNKISHLLVT